MGILNSIKKWVDKINPFSKKDGREVVKKLLENPVHINKLIRDKTITDGTIVYFEYNAKDQTNVFDMKPLIIVFGISRGHILGLNFHWIPMDYRKKLVEHIIDVNTKNKHIQTPLVFHYKDFKPLLKNPVFRKSVRLYIRKRVSINCVVIDPKYLMDAVRLQLEHFSE